jgi:MFS-type transporter involved in bile tolerance (Atg22 family)
LILIFTAYSPPVAIAIQLVLFGILFALAINQIGTCVQRNLSHHHYSWYETRAQIAGRISTLLSITLCGFLLDYEMPVKAILCSTGFVAIISAFILRIAYHRLELFEIEECFKAKYV